MKKTFLISLSLMLLGAFTQAQTAGSLDTAFGTDGKVTANFGQGDFIVTSQAIQNDEKIVLAGYMDNRNVQYGLLVRLNADGTLDTTFNNSGKLFNTSIVSFVSVEIQPDGKILVGGNDRTINYNPAMARYNENGTLDSSFDGDGIVDLPLAPFSANFTDFALQADGKIAILTSYSGTNSDYRIVRLNANGSLDAGFGTNGAVVTDVGFSENAKSIIIQADNKIVVGGNTYTTGSDVFLTRHNANGTLDLTFNGSGKKIISYPGSTSDQFFSIAQQADGKIVFNGFAYVSPNKKSLVGRLNTNGSADTTFDGDGFAMTTASVGDSGGKGRVKIQADAKIVVLNRLSTLTPDTNREVLITRYNTNGTLDTTFNGDGMLSYSYFSGNDYGDDFNFVGSNILVSGNTEETLYINKIALSKITANGNFDTTFDGDGKLVFTFPYAANDVIFSTYLQPDGKIVAAGNSFVNDRTNFSVSRFNANGTIDTSFGSNGNTLLPNLFGHGTIHDITEDSNGNILIAGESDFVEIYRLNSSGMLDTTFGVNGKADLTDNFGGAYSIKVLPNGKILVAGQEASDFNGVFSGNYMLGRLNANGTPDTSFGTADGISNAASTDDPNEILLKIAVLPNGKILAMTSISTGSDHDIAIIRYNSNGTLDTTFNGNGFSTFGSEQYDTPTDLAVQNDGKILVSALYGNQADQFTVVRLNSDGSLDTTFGNNGSVQTTVEGASQSQAIKICADQKIIVVGSAGTDNVKFAMAKYNTNGSIDTAFGNQGFVTTDFDAGLDAAYTVLLTPDNKLILGGLAFTNNSNDFALAKYFADDNLATASESNAILAFAPNPVIDSIYFSKDIQSVAVVTVDGKIVSLPSLNNRVEASQLPRGVYFMKVILADGKTSNAKFIKD